MRAVTGSKNSKFWEVFPQIWKIFTLILRGISFLLIVVQVLKALLSQFVHHTLYLFSNLVLMSVLMKWFNLPFKTWNKGKFLDQFQKNTLKIWDSQNPNDSLVPKSKGNLETRRHFKNYFRNPFFRIHV